MRKVDQRRERSRRLHPLVGALLALALGLASSALLACSEAPRTPDLLLVSVDTLRADHLGVYGRRPSLTPNVDALAAEGLRFERAYAPAPFTLPSIAALLTGRPPETIGVTSNESILAQGVPTLASRLAEAGFETAAVVSNFIINPKSDLDRGFERYDHHLVFGKIVERNATQTTDAAVAELARLTAGDAPYFLWVHYMDPHVPYHAPERYTARHLASERSAPGGGRRLPVRPQGQGGVPQLVAGDAVEDVGTYRAQYAGEVEYVDAEIGRLLAALGERGPDTVVVFVADHGESIGENDFWFTHGRYLSEALVRVPLILRAPGLTPGVRDDVAGLLDLAPTLLALLGVGADALPGRDLLAAGAGLASSEVLLANHHRPMERVGLVADGYKYVRERQGARIDESVIRLGGDDAHLEPAPERIPAMRARLRTLRSELRTAPERRQALSEDDEAALRALGYAE